MKFSRLWLLVFGAWLGLSNTPGQAQQAAGDARTMKPGQMTKIEKEWCRLFLLPGPSTCTCTSSHPTAAPQTAMFRTHRYLRR